MNQASENWTWIVLALLACAVPWRTGAAVGTGPSGGNSGVNYINVGGDLEVPLTNAVAGGCYDIGPGTYQIFARTNFPGNGDGRSGITLRNKSRLTIEGHGYPILSFTNIGGGILMADCDHITLRGLVLSGTHPLTTNLPITSQLFIGAIEITNCSHVLIEDCVISNWVAHGILDLGVLGNGVDSTNNIVIRRNFITRCGRWIPAEGRYEGSACEPNGGWIVEQNRIEDTSRGVEMYPNDVGGIGFRRHMVVRHNWFKNILDSAVLGIGPTGTNLVSADIYGNTIEQVIGFVHFNGSNELVGATGITCENIAEARVQANTIKGKANGMYLNWTSTIGTEKVAILDNAISDTSPTAASIGGGIGLQAASGSGGAGTLQRDILIARNFFYNTQNRAMYISLRDAIIENNWLQNCDRAAFTTSAIQLIDTGNGASNVVFRWNTIRDEGSALTQWGIQIDSGCEKVRLENNRIDNMGRGAITNSAGAGVVSYIGQGKAIIPTITTNTYINAIDETLIGIGNATSSAATPGKTNKLVDTIMFGHGSLEGYTVTVYDATQNAAGTNLWLIPAATQKIFPGGFSSTNLTQNGSSITLTVGGVGGTNWFVTAKSL